MRRLFCLISVFLMLFVFAGDAGFSRCSAAWAEEDDISGGGPNGESSVRQLTMKDVQAMNPDSPVQASLTWQRSYMVILLRNAARGTERLGQASSEPI